mgnify:CR=1 FL=1
MRLQRVFNKDIAVALIRNGHDLISCEPHRENEKLTIFLFEKNDQLFKDLNELLAK